MNKMGLEQQTGSMKKLMVTEEGERIWYAEKTDGVIEVYNQIRNEFLGRIEKMRAGKFMHWCFCPAEELFFTNGCLKEIVEFITKLYSKENKNK